MKLTMVALALALMMATGCASMYKPETWRPADGVVKTEREGHADRAACLALAGGVGVRGEDVAIALARQNEVFRECMLGKGWALASSSPPSSR